MFPDLVETSSYQNNKGFDERSIITKFVRYVFDLLLKKVIAVSFKELFKDIKLDYSTEGDKKSADYKE